jgi:beta-lactamase class A
MSRQRCHSILLVVLFTFPLLAQNTSAQDTATRKQEALWHKLEQRIQTIDRDFDGVMGIAVLDLASGRTIFINPDEVFPTASSIKVAVLAELYRQTERGGQAKLTDLYTFDPKDLVDDSQIMAGLTPGISKVTNRDLATFMVAVSDNAATNVLIDRVGMQNVNTMLQSMGLKETRLRRKMIDLNAAKEGRENTSTPREMMQFFQQINFGKLLGKETQQEFFRQLSTKKDSWMPKLLPEDLQIANKPGALEGVRNDVALVNLPKRPYILCIFTTYDQDERAAEDAISDISLAAYETFDRLARASQYGRVISPRTSR